MRAFGRSYGAWRRNSYKIRVTLARKRIGGGQLIGVVTLDMTGQEEIIPDRRSTFPPTGPTHPLINQPH